MVLKFDEGGGLTNEADDVLLRFRTTRPAGLLLTTRHDRSLDVLDIRLEGARVRVHLQMGNGHGGAEKTFYVGQSLNDDIYHSFVFRRRGTKISALIDDDEPVVEEIASKVTLLSYSRIFIGSTNSADSGNANSLFNGAVFGSTSSSSFSPSLPPRAEDFSGSMQQLIINGREYFDLAATGQLTKQESSASVVQSSPESTVHHAVSFAAQNTYIGLPQMKAYDSIDVRFQFRTFEQNGLMLYNPGKASDFMAVELINGRLHYTLNLGYGPITIKDNAGGTLSDNKWHRVSIGRPSRYKHTLMVDGHVASASTRGDNFHLDLDGILFLGKFVVTQNQS